MKKFFTLFAITAICIGGAAQTTDGIEAASVSLPDFDEDNVTVITQQPPGDIKYYERAGFEVRMTEEGPVITNQSGYISVVYGENNEVWINNPISNDARQSWVKGIIQSDNKTIKVATGQFTDYMPSLTFGRQLWMLAYNASTGMYTVNPTITEISYTLADGKIFLEGTSQQQIIGSVFRAKGQTQEEYHYEGTWSGYGNYESVYTPFADSPWVVPEGAKAEPFKFRAPLSASGQWRMNVMDATLYTDGSDVYLKGFCPSGLYSTEPNWTIKGYKDGDNVIFPSGQFLGTYYDNLYNLTSSAKDSSEPCDIVFTQTQPQEYESDNLIRFSSSANPADEYFYYDGATLSQLPLPVMSTPPAEANSHLFKMDYKGYIQSIDFYYDSSTNVTVALSGNKIYIKGLYFGVPDAWIEGDIANGKAVFKSTQYLGYLSDQYPEMWFMAFGDEFDKPLDSIEFDFDSQTCTLSNPTANISISICNRRNLGLQWFFSPSLQIIEITPAIPSAPYDLKWETVDWDPVPRFVFTIPTKGTEGEELVENWLYYRMYTDSDNGQSLFAMTPDDYPDMNLSSPIDMFPYNYMAWDISYSYGAHYINIRNNIEGITRFGVQSVYRTGDIENTSDIVWIELPQSAIGNISYENSNHTTPLFNLQGQIVTGNPAPGIYISNGKKIVIK